MRNVLVWSWKHLGGRVVDIYFLLNKRKKGPLLHPSQDTMEGGHPQRAQAVTAEFSIGTNQLILFPCSAPSQSVEKWRRALVGLCALRDAYSCELRWTGWRALIRLLGLPNTLYMRMEDMISDGTGAGGTNKQEFHVTFLCLNYIVCKLDGWFCSQYLVPQSDLTCTATSVASAFFFLPWEKAFIPCLLFGWQLKLL